MPEIVVIAALAEESRVIGRGLELPWRLPDDLRRFKELTMGHPVVMGRRTFEALLHQTGRPLTGRENVVLSRGSARDDFPEGVTVFRSMGSALGALADRERVFIGGGASVYAEALATAGRQPLADRLELTIVEADPDGDAYFPPWRHLVGPVYELAVRERREAADGRPAFRFETYTRRAAP